MKVFVIFFCMAFVYTCFDLQRAEDAQSDLKSNYYNRCFSDR